ncbi:MAG TPA: lipocalin family protein [Ferruginibacter sp.]|nr:lipocalin family protein [Ferruginibacter sp.]
MKRLIYLSSFLLLASITISSCKKSSTNSSIVGNWELTSLHSVTTDSTTTPITVTTYDTAVTHSHAEVISFFADNSVTEYSFLSSPATLIDGGNYLVLGDSLTIFNSGSTTGQTFKFTLSGNNLTIFVDQSSPGYLYLATEKFDRQ